MLEPTKRAIRRALNGEVRLWKIWWLGGIPVGWTTSALTVFAELARVAGCMERGDLLDAVKLLVYLSWCRLAWRCSHNVGNTLWTPVSRFALSAGLVLVVVF